MSAPAPKRRLPGQLTLFQALKRRAEPDEDVPPSGFNAETPPGDLNAVTERSDLTSPCRPATSPPSASPAAKKRSVEPDVIGKTSFHFGKTRSSLKEVKNRHSEKTPDFQNFLGRCPRPRWGGGEGAYSAPPRTPQLVLSRATHGCLASRDLSYSCFPFGAPSSLKSWIRQCRGFIGNGEPPPPQQH